MVERNFDEEFEYGKREGHTFVLGGITFHTRAITPPIIFLSEHREKGVQGSADFIRMMVQEDEVEAFNKILENSDPPVSIHQIGELSSWLVEVTSGRPPEAPGSSGAGREETGDSSKENSS